MDHNQTIGAKIKTLRTDKHYTLKTLSDKTGLSVGFLSQAERGLSSIAVDSLAKVAACLDELWGWLEWIWMLSPG